MASTKIINVLKGDTFDELLDIFKDNDAEEVIFVLPKNGKFLSDEEHFAILAEASKEVSRSVAILCSNPHTNQTARQYGFNVLDQKTASESKPVKPAPAQLAKAVMAHQDPDVIDDSTDAFTDDVIIPSDEKMGIESESSDEDEASGMHIIDPDEEEDDDKEPSVKDLEEDDIDDTKEESAIEEFYRKAHDPEANFTIAPISKGGQYKAQMAAKTGKITSMDGMIRVDTETGQNIRVSQKREKPTPVGIAKHPASAKEDQTIESVWNDSREEQKNTESLWTRVSSIGQGARTSRPNKTTGRKWLYGILAVVAVFAVTLLLYPEKAQITLIPLKQALNFQTKVEIGDSIGSVDAVFNKIPGQLFTIDHTVRQDFPSSGQKEVAQKARGKITVYNSYGTTPQTLIATTRFESSEGFIFRTLKTIIVPGTSVANGKITPGKIDVEVIADKPGASYNVASGKFTIPAFKEKGDTDRYEKFYGQSDQAFTQGASGLAKVVTESDYSKAKDEITARFKREIGDMLKSQSADLKTIGIADASIKDISSTAEVDQAADNFTMSVTGTIRVIGYKDADVLEFIKQYVKRDQNLVVIPDKMEYTLAEVAIPADKTSITTSIQVKGPGFPEIDLIAILSDLKGKSEDELKIYLKSLPSITKANVNIQSIWGNKVPMDTNKIRLDVDYGN